LKRLKPAGDKTAKGLFNTGRKLRKLSRQHVRVVVDSHLCFTEHTANIVRKAHQRANLIHRCFTSKNPDLLVKAFKVYVRPILEFNSPVWSPGLLKDILLIESVQRKFTKRILSMSGLTYYSRLQVLGLESLEIRRLRTNVLLVYRIMFGMVRLNSNEFFTLRNQPHLKQLFSNRNRQRKE